MMKWTEGGERRCSVHDGENISFAAAVTLCLIKKVQCGCWMSCLDGGMIVRFSSLLGHVKHA